jgi:hypothetical protein
VPLVVVPLIALIPVVAGALNTPELVVVDNGIRMPVQEAPAPIAPLEEQVVPEEVAPAPAPAPAPVVPVYPVRQARH